MSELTKKQRELIRFRIREQQHICHMFASLSFDEARALLDMADMADSAAAWKELAGEMGEELRTIEKESVRCPDPNCRNAYQKGHETDCSLAAVLKKFEEMKK